MSELVSAIERAFTLTEAWYRDLRRFGAGPPHNKSGSVEGFRGPTLLSEADCAFHYARFLQQCGVPWEDLHLELSRSQWLFDDDHPAAHTDSWRADLVIATEGPFLAAKLPAARGTYAFDAIFEFKRIGPGSGASRADVQGDIQKIAECYLVPGVAKLGYAVVFQDEPPSRNKLDREWQTQMRLAFPTVKAVVLDGDSAN